MFSVISASTGLGAWFSGSYRHRPVAVVGAQSAFILRQGILRKHIVPVVATCAAIDAIFIFASVAGLRTLTRRCRGRPAPCCGPAWHSWPGTR